MWINETSNISRNKLHDKPQHNSWFLLIHKWIEIDVRLMSTWWLGEGKTAGAVNRGSFISHFIMMCLHMVLESLEHSIHNNTLNVFLVPSFYSCSPKQPFHWIRKRVDGLNGSLEFKMLTTMLEILGSEAHWRSLKRWKSPHRPKKFSIAAFIFLPRSFFRFPKKRHTKVNKPNGICNKRNIRNMCLPLKMENLFSPAVN